MFQINLRSTASTAARIVVWLAAALLLLMLAWVLSNLRDIDPVPRPAALAVPAATVADDANAAFALAALDAAPDREPAVVGLALWRLRLPDPAAPHKPLDSSAAQALRQAESQALGERLSVPTSFLCDPSQADCAQQWIGQADKLAALRLPHVAFGRRCEDLLGSRFEFEEPLPPTLSADGPLAIHALGASHCSKWLISGAVVAWVRGDRALSMAIFERADRLGRRLLAGSRTLIGHMLALRHARNTVNVIAAVAVRDPAVAAALAPLLAPWPDHVQAARRWMRAEAAFQQNMLADAWRQCRSPADVIGEEALTWWDEIEGKLGLLACRHNIGLHPERTLAALDAMWLHKFAALDAGLPAAIARLAVDSKAANDTSTLGLLTWRNPVGSLLISVAEPAYGNYLTRQADLELHREAALLAVQAARLAAPERAAWTARQSPRPLRKAA